MSRTSMVSATSRRAVTDNVSSPATSPPGSDHRPGSAPEWVRESNTQSEGWTSVSSAEDGVRTWKTTLRTSTRSTPELEGSDPAAGMASIVWSGAP